MVLCGIPEEKYILGPMARSSRHSRSKNIPDKKTVQLYRPQNAEWTDVESVSSITVDI